MSARADAHGEARDEAQARTAMLGMILFIGSWVMLFAALFFSYGVARVNAPAWPPVDLPRLPLALPGIATLVLAASSVLLARAHVAAAAVCGSLFLAIQIHVWRALYTAGLLPTSGNYGSVFYGFTFFHALHLLIGLGALFVLAAGFARSSLRLWTIYWHVLGGVWGLLYLTVYVI